MLRRLPPRRPEPCAFWPGGTDVLVQMRAGVVQPDDLIDLKHIPGVDKIERTPDGGWKIGVAVPGIVLGGHEALVADWPGVVEGMNLVGSTQVQGRATLAGNLCNGSPAADSVPGLIAAGAVVTVTGPNGSRDIPVEQVPAGPGKTSLAKGEIISSITLPRAARTGRRLSALHSPDRDGHRRRRLRGQPAAGRRQDRRGAGGAGRSRSDRDPVRGGGQGDHRHDTG